MGTRLARQGRPEDATSYSMLWIPVCRGLVKTKTKFWCRGLIIGSIRDKYQYEVDGSEAYKPRRRTSRQQQPLLRGLLRGLIGIGGGVSAVSDTDDDDDDDGSPPRPRPRVRIDPEAKA